MVVAEFGGSVPSCGRGLVTCAGKVSLEGVDV